MKKVLLLIAATALIVSCKSKAESVAEQIHELEMQEPCKLMLNDTTLNKPCGEDPKMMEIAQKKFKLVSELSDEEGKEVGRILKEKYGQK